MSTLMNLIALAIDLYTFVIILQVAVSWLTIFEVVNLAHPQAQNLVDLLKKLTDPVYKPIQKYVPPIGGIDITPIIVILGLSLLERVISSFIL
jgi:YggT family protein